MRSKFFVLILVLVSSSGMAWAQTSRPQPTPPTLMPANFKAMSDRAAYAAFLADACSFNSQIQDLLKKVISGFEANDERQSSLLSNFRQLRSKHASNANPIGVAKRCYLESAKTKALISDVGSELEEMALQIEKKDSAYKLDLAKWQEEQRAIALAIAEKIRADQERSEREARERNQATAERHSDQLGRLVVANKYDGGNNVSVILKDWSYNDSEKSMSMKVEIKWYGKFTGKSYGADGIIKAVYDGSSSWTWELGRNYFWNPTWLSSTLESYLRCSRTLFGSCD